VVGVAGRETRCEGGNMRRAALPFILTLILLGCDDELTEPDLSEYLTREMKVSVETVDIPFSRLSDTDDPLTNVTRTPLVEARVMLDSHIYKKPRGEIVLTTDVSGFASEVIYRGPWDFWVAPKGSSTTFEEVRGNRGNVLTCVLERTRRSGYGAGIVPDGDFGPPHSILCLGSG